MMVNRVCLSLLFWCLALGGCGGGPLPEDEAGSVGSEVRQISWEELVPEGEEERLIALYAEQYAGAGNLADIEEGGASDVAIQLRAFSTVAGLDGAAVRLAGYTVPLDYGVDVQITEFLLVPYYGACLHLPPPPPNQTILVRTAVPIKLKDLKQAVWVEGVLRISTEETALADVAYQLELSGLEPY